MNCSVRAAIVLGCYNNSDFILDAIDSIRNQTVDCWQCIIVDNSSSDDSIVLIDKNIYDDGRFSLFSKLNEGPGAWRNFGASLVMTSVEYVHFLDGDDTINPMLLETAIHYLDDHPHVGLLSVQFNIINATGDLVGPGFRSRYAPSKSGLPAPIPDSSIPTPFVSFFAATGQGPFCIFRKSVFDQTDGYETDFWSHEDSDICCQMALLTECHQLPQRLYNKRTHSTNLTYSPRADYSKFRKKWDNAIARNPSEARVIDDALNYYYTRHMPMRDFRVSVKAMREFSTSGSVTKLKFALRLLLHGFQNILFHSEYRRILNSRNCRLS